MNKNMRNLLWTAGGVLLGLAINKALGVSQKTPKVF